MALLLGSVPFFAYPQSAGAQQPQDPHMFGTRMSARIDRVQARIKNLQNELTSGEQGDGGSSEFEAGGGVLGELEALEEQCRKLQRELDSGTLRGGGPPSVIYDRQRQIEYYVWGMERQLQEIRRWMRPQDDETESSVEPRPEVDTEEDGISDEDWAADWAKGTD